MDPLGFRNSICEWSIRLCHSTEMILLPFVRPMLGSFWWILPCLPWQACSFEAMFLGWVVAWNHLFFDDVISNWIYTLYLSIGLPNILGSIIPQLLINQPGFWTPNMLFGWSPWLQRQPTISAELSWRKTASCFSGAVSAKNIGCWLDQRRHRTWVTCAMPRSDDGNQERCGLRVSDVQGFRAMMFFLMNLYFFTSSLCCSRQTGGCWDVQVPKRPQALPQEMMKNVSDKRKLNSVYS